MATGAEAGFFFLPVGGHGGLREHKEAKKKREKKQVSLRLANILQHELQVKMGGGLHVAVAGIAPSYQGNQHQAFVFKDGGAIDIHHLIEQQVAAGAGRK